MVWGWFSASVGRGRLFFLPKYQMMNGDVYMGVLEDHLVLFISVANRPKFLPQNTKVAGKKYQKILH
jgi:hypothetical protein